MTALPILYSFRRCPYAMRARMALWIAGVTVELREVKLASKPPEMLEASPKGTVPVLQCCGPYPFVMDESLIIMRWALRGAGEVGQRWLGGIDHDLLAANDGPFKRDLDRYKYPSRYPEESGVDLDAFRLKHRTRGREFLELLDKRLALWPQLGGESPNLTDIALFPFIRQFADTDRDWFDAQELPHLQRWLAGHLTSDLFAAVMGKFAPWKAGEAPVLFGPPLP